MSETTSFTPRSSKKSKIGYSSSFKGSGKGSNDQNDVPFSRESELRHSTGSIKGKRMDVRTSSKVSMNPEDQADSATNTTTVHSLIKGFQSKIVNGGAKRPSVSGSDNYSYQSDAYLTPGYVAESPVHGKRPTTKRKLSLRYKKGKLNDDEARYTILQSLGLSPGNENRSENKSFGYFDSESLFFAFANAASLKCLYEEGSQYTKKLTGASAASVRNAPGRKRLKSGEFDPNTGRFLSRAESMIDEGDNKESHLLLNCPYFRNEIAEPEEKHSENPGDSSSKHTKDIAKLISMFNRNRSFENLRNNAYDGSKRHARSRKEFDSAEQDILFEEVKDDSIFLSWDEPNVNSGNRIFDFEHIDRGAMYYREYFSTKDHINLFGIDEKFGPMAISIVREALPGTAVLGHTNDASGKNKKYQYRIVFRTCELYALRMSVPENSIPSLSRHGGSRPLPLKDLLEFCFPEIQSSCLRHCIPGPKISEQLIKLDEQQLMLKYKIGLIYCKAGQTSEEEMYNNENGGSEFLEFCSFIADKVALKGFQGYRAQLDNKNDSTGAHSLYTTFHGREIMFHVSTELPYTGHDRQQLLRKRHIGNDIVTVIFQEPGSEPFTPQMMRSHFQHVFVIVRVENPHTDQTRYEIAVTRSRDVPYFGPPVPPNKFSKNDAFKEYFLSKLINAENAAHKSDKFTHMARRTRYEYLKDLATNQISSQTIEPSNKFAFSFSTKKKEKSHPPVNPEIWLQSGMVWTVKYEHEHDGPGSASYLSISTKSIVFIERSTQEILVSIPCKNVLGWRPTTHTLKLFYDNGKMAYFSLCDDDLNELTHVLNRLKTVTPGCETEDLFLRRNNDGQLGFHVYYEGLVAEVEAYGLAWQAGLRKGSRILEISGSVVSSIPHERMILMLKRLGSVRIVVLPPAPDGHPRNYKAVRNLRRYSSMTSVYSMSTTALAGMGDSSSMYSSIENLTGSCTESSPQDAKVTHTSPPTKSGITRNESTSSTSAASDVSGNYNIGTPANKPLVERKKSSSQSTERLITSRSASDIMAANSPQQKNRGPFAPSESVELELGEIERKLTDTRKSIDAKFYRSLANTPSPFFPNKNPPDVILETPDSLHQEMHETGSSELSRPVVVPTRASDVHNPVVHERLNIVISGDKAVVKSEDSKKRETVPTVMSPRGNDGKSERKYEFNQRTSNRNSLEEAFENSQVPPTPRESISSDPTNSLEKPEKHGFSRQSHVDIDVISKMGKMQITNTNSMERRRYIESEVMESHSDGNLSSRSKSRENLMNDSDSARKGNIVRSKVRDAKEIISERHSVKDSPPILRRIHKSQSVEKSTKDTAKIENYVKRHSLGSTKNSGELIKTLSPDASPRLALRVSPRSPNLNHRDNALIRAVDAAAKSKLHQCHDEHLRHSHEIPPIRKFEVRHTQQMDESLSETFAKIDAAFAFKPGSDTPPRDEKRRKRRSSRRRSRNYEPPSSDSSEDVNPDPKRRGSRAAKRFTPEDLSPKLTKSEAEESLEAAISEFQLELSSMPEKSRSSSIASTISANSVSLPSATSSPRMEKAYHFGKTYSHSTGSFDDTNPPKVPIRTSRPQILIDHQKLMQLRNDFKSARPSVDHASSSESSVSHNASKMSSEANVCVTALRPWSPPQSRHKTSASIKEQVKTCSNRNAVGKVTAFDSPKSLKDDKTLFKFDVSASNPPKRQELKGEYGHGLPNGKSDAMFHESTSRKSPHLSDLHLAKNADQVIEDAIEVVALQDQLSPLPLRVNMGRPTPSGIHSLPNRSKKRRVTLTERSMSESGETACIPLGVRGLDLAASSSGEAPRCREDMHVMITVMKQELELEREEKVRLSEELCRSKEEKERLLEQSKQAASQLRKFTSLFLDASPQELEKAKQRYNESR